jgi:phosphoribosylformylglycinamidine synthase
MIIFFQNGNQFFAVDSSVSFTEDDHLKLAWLFGNARYVNKDVISGYFTGPRKEMITPWSTNAVEITQIMGISGIRRIEGFTAVDNAGHPFDHMLQKLYTGLGQDLFRIDKTPDPIETIDDIAAYNMKEGLALSSEEIRYLEDLSTRIGRKLTDSEVFGFSQVNSEHCRHKIFNGTFIIDGETMPHSLFDMIKLTSHLHPNRLVSAYKDNCAFVLGSRAEQFAPITQDKSDYFVISDIDTVISLKAETHNFPTTVEPFNGAATGSGGEIRDRMAGGRGGITMAGTAVYITSYPRLEASRSWEQHSRPRQWLYQTPEEILIKASNGASDFGNKYGQPLICGSLLTFEYFNDGKTYGYDKVIMLAGGIGQARLDDSEKALPGVGDKIIVMGGDNYRIGMGGGAVSSVATGEYNNQIELNAVQRSNPEMQKRVYNAVRALTETGHNPIVSIHDHGAGGHLNSLSELVGETGGIIDLSALPVGDTTLSAREIIGNESQERMGLILQTEDVPLLQNIAERERAPLYVVGEVTGDDRFVIKDKKTGQKPIDLSLEDMFGKPPATVIRDTSLDISFDDQHYDPTLLQKYLEDVLQLEAVACKDWLTNKVDRSVTGKVAFQQTAGVVQLPVNDLGAVAMDYRGKKGIATSVGHAPVAGLVDPVKASRLAIAEALTNLIWAPLEGGIKSVSLSANWMWPAKNKGEDARLYKAVKAASDFAIELGINIPTGKDSLSMTQKYPDGEVVIAPGTVIISTVGEVSDVRKIVSPVLKEDPGTVVVYIDLSGDHYHLGGSSFAQVINSPGTITPTVRDSGYFIKVFDVIQRLIEEELVIAGHDISAGGMITTLLEMMFPGNTSGLEINLDGPDETDIIRLLFSENPGIIIQIDKSSPALKHLDNNTITYHVIGHPTVKRSIEIRHGSIGYSFDIDSLRDIWYKTSYLLERKQTVPALALQRYMNYKNQTLTFSFPNHFTGKASLFNIDLDRRKPTGFKAAIIREKGVNGDREMAYSLYLAGFDVKDVHMTDLVAGRETLSDIRFIVFVGGFSNSDVLGSAKGWAGAFVYNDKARNALEDFYGRKDTMSLGICNGCQLMIELGLITPEHSVKPRMLVNTSGKFESAFLNVTIQDNTSVMFGSMTGSRLGIWVAHGEGQFSFPYGEDAYHIPVKFSYPDYPGNPNGSMYAAAALCSGDGRHMAMMPHIERAMLSWQWACYPDGRKKDEITPWVEAFVNAREWIKSHNSATL